MPTIQNPKNTTISTNTIVEPTGVEIIIEISIPDSAQITDTIAEQTVTDLKVLNTRIEDNAGKITNAEIKSEPIVARLKADETKTTTVIHCKRRMSIYNYYIVLPELAEDFVIPTTLIAKATDTKTKYIIVNEKNKSETVTDHGYVFVKWGEN